MNVGDRVKWKQPTEGVVTAVGSWGFTVLFDGQAGSWTFDPDEEADQFEVIA